MRGSAGEARRLRGRVGARGYQGPGAEPGPFPGETLIKVPFASCASLTTPGRGRARKGAPLCSGSGEGPGATLQAVGPWPPRPLGALGVVCGTAQRPACCNQMSVVMGPAPLGPQLRLGWDLPDLPAPPCPLRCSFQPQVPRLPSGCPTQNPVAWGPRLGALVGSGGPRPGNGGAGVGLSPEGAGSADRPEPVWLLATPDHPASGSGACPARSGPMPVATPCVSAGRCTQCWTRAQCTAARGREVRGQ